VHCSDAELVDFPWTLPEETTELYLQRNNLTAVPRTVVRDLHHLKVLNIANNWISIVNAETVARALQLDAL
jgi:Leucine-rich repeat (LRR) protein